MQMLNGDERKAFDRIADAVNGRGEQRCFFIEGAGGCGKTYLYNTLIRWCLAGKPAECADSEEPEEQQQPKLCSTSVIAAASTGIAALLLIGGGTVHRQFSVPNDVDDDTSVRIGFETAGADRLRNAQLIIIDEVSMLSNKILRYLDRLLRDVTAMNTPFGGKVLLLGGDWKQLAPVVEHGTREDQVQESIKIDPLFEHNFERLSLTINMRTAPGQLALLKLLDDIGNGRPSQKAGARRSKGPANLVKIPEANVARSLDEIVDFCFPPALFTQPEQYAESLTNNAILCPTNKEVMRINEMALERLAGAPTIFESIDAPLDGNDTFGTFRSDFNLEAVHNEMPSGMPPHKLTLKVGAPVMLIRNLDVSRGLCNGTRMQIEHITSENLMCRLLTGPRAGQTYLIPRIKFEYGHERKHRGLRFRRLQFPVRPCFAMTVNKAQGQTLQRMALVLSGKQCFSHGQVYVAMSRVTSLDGIRVFSPNTMSRGGEVYIQNVVYHELLNDPVVAPFPQQIPSANLGAGADISDEEEDALF